MSAKRLNRAEIARVLARDTMDQADPRFDPPARLPKHERKAQRMERRGAALALPTVAFASSEPLPQVLPVADGVPVRAWTNELKAGAWAQIQHVAQLPFLHPKGLALMPDVHVGNGACVGSVLPMRGALVPSACGVDLGCGMVAVRLDLQASDLPDSLRAVRLAIEAAVPVGTSGQHDEVQAPEVWAGLLARYTPLVSKHKAIYKRHAGVQLGTLGSGNHFIEVCLDQDQQVWVMLHSGSRGAGNLIGQHFISEALKRCDREELWLPNRSLGYLDEGTGLFEDYRQSVLWAQDYAFENRKLMLSATLQALRQVLGRRIGVIGEAVNCHHNYIAREHHMGEDLWVTRKGAIRAGVGEWGIIPGSMGAESFIVRGKGNTDSYCSCAHGAGRLMSRAQARSQFTASDLKRQTAGVECRKDSAVVDEIPGAYKPIRTVMAQQQDLVEVMHTLRQVVCVKGS